MKEYNIILFLIALYVLPVKVLFAGIVLVYLYNFVFYQVESYLAVEDPVLNELRDQLCELHPKLKNISVYIGDKSYTINKKTVYICSKDENGRYYNRNMLVYVMCHEFAHVICEDVGHEGSFPEVFENLLQEASRRRLYDPNIPLIKNYCGYD
jgi:hypothetical protein